MPLSLRRPLPALAAVLVAELIAALDVLALLQSAHAASSTLCSEQTASVSGGTYVIQNKMSTIPAPRSA